jgi:microcystin degradation protein MlrC
MWAGVPVDLGPTAVLRIGGVRAIVSSNNLQVTDRRFFLSQGIDPAGLSVVAVKSAQHFRAAFEPIARKLVFVDSGGLASADFRRFPYRKLRRPIWPLDEIPVS